MLQVGYRPDTTLIAGNQQPETAYRTMSHLTPNTPNPSDPRSSNHSATSSASSGASFFRTSVPSRQSGHYSHSHSQHSNPSPQTPYTQSHYATAVLPTTAPSPIHASDPRQRSPSRIKRPSQDAQPLLQTIKLRDLSHVVQIAQDDIRNLSRSPARRSSRRGPSAPSGPGSGPPDDDRRQSEDCRRYEISGMPVTDVIEMVARLLTKITTTNDRQHHDVHRSMSPADGNSSANPTTSSILAFHGKNIPSITIQSYLSRIHKYCPTSYEVFLSLLVYFDRMTEKVNRKPIEQWRNANANSGASTPASALSGGPTTSGLSLQNSYSHSHFFVVDSFNIHRLVIAGVTCASKFFSDIFYTNSRYAKVGGLPLVELNHLELQFLILNDFRLAVPVEELEAYGTMLVSFYAREEIASANLQAMNLAPPPPNPENRNSGDHNP